MSPTKNRITLFLSCPALSPQYTHNANSCKTVKSCCAFTIKHVFLLPAFLLQLHKYKNILQPYELHRMSKKNKPLQFVFKKELQKNLVVQLLFRQFAMLQKHFFQRCPLNN